jgi:hypothetical protein
MRIIDDTERRARLVRNHLLAGTGDDPGAVAGAVVGVHSSDPATVYLSMWARIADFAVADLEAALYENHDLIRVLGMRRTMFVTHKGLAPLVHSSSTTALIPAERRRTVNLIEGAGIAADGSAWLTSVSNRTVAALERVGPATAVELKAEVPELDARIEYLRGDGSVLGVGGLSTRVLFLLALEGRIIRGRPRGTWQSSLYEWATMEQWTGLDLSEAPDKAAAQSAMVTAYLRSYGPATEVDVKWWTGWPVREVRKALEQEDIVEVETSAGPAFLVVDDLDPVSLDTDGFFMLPSLDSTSMGWKLRDWYLGAHGAELYDRNGNAGPTIWVGGRMVGGWSQRKSGELMYRFLEDVGSGAVDQTEAELERLARWLDGAVITARFRSPLDLELATG